MTDIPLAREFLREALDLLPRPHPVRNRIRAALALMTRRRAKRPEGVERYMSARRAAEVWEYRRAHPEAPPEEIAGTLRVSISAVKDVLAGIKHPETKTPANQKTLI